MKQTYIFSYHKFPKPEILQFEQKWKFLNQVHWCQISAVVNLFIKLILYASIVIHSYVIKK